MRMRPSADIRAPGIYQTVDPVVIPPLEVADTRIAGFLGLSLKGPMNEPTRIASWDEFVETFGYTDRHYLSDSVHGFFKNGGQAVWVVRIAHAAPPGTLPTIDHAACADHVQIDDWNKPSLKIRALNEGEWGNNIWFKCVHTTGASALLTRDLEVGAGEAHVSQTRGFEVGALVRIYDRENSDYVVLTEVADKRLKWASATPVNRKHKAAAPTHLEVMEFEIHVAMKDRREVFKGLQMDPASRLYGPRVVAARSRLIRLEDLGTKSPVPHNLPEPMPLTRLTGGRDGIDALTPEDFIGIDHGPGERAGLLALSQIEEVTQIAAPDAMVFYEREPGPAGELKSQRVQDQMITQCELVKDKFAILDIPGTKDIEWVRKWRRRTDSSYCAYYWPWIKIENLSGRVRPVPPSGFLAGVYAQRDNEGVHVAPANVSIEGAVDLALRVTEDHLGLLNSDLVNSFRIQRGVRPWGVRTSSSDPDWRYISIRRLFIMLRRSLEAGYAWVAFEPNSERTWEFVKDRTVAFLTDLQKRGMLAGGNPDEAFFVKCDAETNPPENIDQGILVCEVGVAPVAPAEFIMISLTQQMGGPPSSGT
jgi:hypothetical protein